MTDARDAATQFVGGVVSVAPFGVGHINETFLVRTSEDEYVLQRVNRTVFPDVDALMTNALAVQRHLFGRFVPEPVATRGGEFLARVGGDAWRAWRRVPGAAPADEVTAVTAGSAGRLLGRFHAALADLDAATLTTTLRGFHDPGRRLAALREIIVADPCGRVSTVVAEIESALAAAPLVERAAQLTRRVPVRVAHNDAKLDNLLFRDREAVCLVDLDTLMPGAWFWDVGDLLRTAATTAAEDELEVDGAVVDPTLHQAILDGYRTGVAPAAEAAEIEALEIAGAIVTYEQALRFLTDWIAGDLYYRTSRPGQNRDRARTQFRLLASMPGTVIAP